MINCIVAISKNQGIGLNGNMPWPRLSGDLAWFKKTTINNVIIMGRKTWESIGSKPLPNRINVVLSQSKIPGCDLSLTEAESCVDIIENLYPNREIFIIGGSAIYELFKFAVDRFYITEIDQEYVCDRFFDFDYVKENFTNVKELATFNEPLNYTIKEYNL